MRPTLRPTRGISRRGSGALDVLFGQYVSPEVKERIKAAAASERKDVVVLFSDLRAYSAWSEAREPEEVVAQLNEYFDAMVRAIRGEGGVVDKFMGDAVMATFGGVLDVERPAAAAVRAARGMARALDTLNERWSEGGRSPLRNGVGIAVGPVVQGPIGSVDRKEFTVIGDTVNSAARLESATREHGVTLLVSDGVYDALDGKDRAGLHALGKIAVKGKTEKLTVYGGA